MNNEENLFAILRSLGRVVVAFSGGVDSSCLLGAACRALAPDNVLAVTADSETIPRTELDAAAELARRLGAPHRILPTRELDSPDFRRNAGDRCFWCKDELFGRIRADVMEPGWALVDGANADDSLDHRPGRRAAAKHGVRSPLAEAGLSKAAVRTLSKKLGLPTWDRPAMACLASRIAYGQPIDAETLARVEAAEALLRRWGFRNVRVRVHGKLCRIEVERARIAELIDRDPAPAFRRLGFSWVTVDLEGFRSGSMNRDLGAASGSPGSTT